MESWSIEAQMKAVERHRDTGAWLQHQQTSALRSKKRFGGTGEDPGQVSDKRPPRGELTRMECPRYPRQPAAHASSAPLHHQLLAEGSPAPSIAHRRPGRSQQRKAAQLPAAVPWQPFLCILSSLFLKCVQPSALRQVPSVPHSWSPNPPLEGFTCSARSGHCFSFPSLSFSFVNRTEFYLETEHLFRTEGSNASF